MASGVAVLAPNFSKQFERFGRRNTGFAPPHLCVLFDSVDGSRMGWLPEFGLVHREGVSFRRKVVTDVDKRGGLERVIRARDRPLRGRQRLEGEDAVDLAVGQRARGGDRRPTGEFVVDIQVAVVMCVDDVGVVLRQSRFR